MKILPLNLAPFSCGLLNETKKQKNEQPNLYKTTSKFNNNISFGAKNKISINAIKKLIDSLTKENIHFELIGTNKSATVVEFKNFRTISQTTTFLKDNIKKIIKYKSDGTPCFAYQYQKNTLQKTIIYAEDGRKLQKDIFYPNGKRKSTTTYVGFANFPKRTKHYHEDGKTIKTLTNYYTNSKQPKDIKEYNSKGIILKETTFNENGKMQIITSYDKNGVPFTTSNFINNNIY